LNQKNITYWRELPDESNLNSDPDYQSTDTYITSTTLDPTTTVDTQKGHSAENSTANTLPDK
jgi:hypothetical protein